MVEPPRWSREQLSEHAAESAELFRKERLGEPLSHWVREFRLRADEFRKLVQWNGVLYPAQLTPQDVVAIFEAGLGDAFRYLAGPPISADDLKTLADVGSLSVANLSADNYAGATAVVDIFRATADPERFTWLDPNRAPSDIEIERVISASAALFAGQRVATTRRNTAKSVQEEAVKTFLQSIGFQPFDTPRQINTLDDAPPRGHYCSECLVGTRKADVPIRLHDGRLMPLECKVSNSAVNSIKRINNDAQVKAAIWLREFGERQVVPAAMLSGVFDVGNLERAQVGHLTLFWAHRMDAMRDFIESTKS